LLLDADDDWTLPGPCIAMGERLLKLGDTVTVKVYTGAVQGVQVGQNPAAREDSWQRVRDTLKEAFAL
jgi:dienelactone hydrolase